jgi:eukaryotic-like serine/threonine-protein kinase
MTELPLPEESIFAQAMEITSATKRAAFLDRACSDNQALRTEVEALLRAQQRSGDLLDLPENAPANAGLTQAIDVPAATNLSACEGRGMVIGPYKLLEPIGEGGMGTVWMAEQTDPIQRRVAVKVVKEGMDSRQVLARFEAERQALALMEHPNIAKVLDAGRTPSGRPYFVMELVKGKPFTTYCDDKQLGLRERLELFGDVCRAVQHAHQKGIIHRDIKPSNVLVAPYDGKPVVKVIDFGVAKATGQRLTDKTVFTGCGSLVGTPEYMSPEQAEVNNQDIDTRSDVYSLGVLLYELLTGSTPLTRKRIKEVALLEVLRVIREDEPPRPSTRLSESKDSLPSISAQRQSEPAKLTKLVRGDLDWIVMKALEKDRNRRYETANGFALDVERYLADEPVQARPPSVGYRLRKLAQRNKGKLTAAAAMLALLLAGTAVSIWQAVRATRAERETSKALVQVTAEQQKTRAALTQTREALDALSDDVVETMFAKQAALGAPEKSFLQKIIGFYEAFTQQSAETTESRFLLAKGHYTVAHLRARLGAHSEAAAGFQQAQALLDVLVREFPDASEFRFKLARTEGNLGVELAKLGKEAEAEAAFRRGIALRTKLVDHFPSDTKYRLDLANNYNDLGFLFELQRKYADAETAYRQSLELKEKLVAEDGASPMYHSELTRALSNIGQLLRKQEKFAESEKVSRQALQIGLEQLQKGPPTTKDRQRLADSYSGLGIALAELKREDEAEQAFRQGLEIRRKLTDDFPGELQYRSELANGSNDLAYLLTRQGKDAQAEEPYRQTLELRKQIVAQAGAVPGYRQALAESLHNLAHVRHVTHQPDAAESGWRDALGVWKQLAADLPLVPEYQDGLAGALTNLATLDNERRNFDAAVARLEEAGPHIQAALKARPTDHGFRQSYRDLLAALAQSRRGLADHARLAATADDLARSACDPAKDSYDASALLAHCVTLARKDSKLAETKRSDIAQTYADRALALLRQAVAHGFKNAAHMSQDPDLEPLRAQAGFKALLSELESQR